MSRAASIPLGLDPRGVLGGGAGVELRIGVRPRRSGEGGGALGDVEQLQGVDVEDVCEKDEDRGAARYEVPAAGLTELAAKCLLPLAKKGGRFYLEPTVAAAVWAEHEERMLAKHRVVPGRRRC